jgi:acetyl-CoA carboxylase biotin carboxylase subunit
MFKRILIANRGEPAVRILRTCRELGIESVVVYSEADRDTLAVRLADQSICIGPAPVADSYENIPRILSAAEISGSEAVHPGYGFLTESPEFAEAVESCKLKFIGPKSETIRKVADRLVARRMMKELGVPVLSGSDEEISPAMDLRKAAEAIGYPIRISPAAQIERSWTVRTEKDLETTVRLAQAEARGALGDPRIYMVRSLETARRIDVPFLSDDQGKVFPLPEQECSVRHRQQLILAETPSPLVTESMQRRLAEWVTSVASALGYTNFGVMEFLADESANLCFLGLRPSLPTEHPATEVVTGVDLVAEQLRISAGEGISAPARERLGPADLRTASHAILCRLEAEDAERDFMPTAGVVTSFRLPGGPGVRVDTHTYAGYKGSALYDTLIAKITACHDTRAAAIARMDRALRETAIEGVKSTLEFQQKVLRLGAFRRGELSTSLLERELLAGR